MTTFTRSRATMDYKHFTPTTAFSNTGLDLARVRKVAPSIFAEHAWQGNDEYAGVSERYAFLPTVAFIEELLSSGWIVTYVAQGNTRIEGRKEFTRHMVRLRQRDGLTNDHRALEVLLINAHDRASALHGYVGWIEFACWNGCVRGDIKYQFHFQHRGSPKGIVTSVQEVMDRGPALLGTLDHYEGIHLSRDEQLVYAESAMLLRYPAPPTIVEGTVIPNAPTHTEHFPFPPEKLLTTAVREQRGDDLQSAYMRAQSGLSEHGGIQGHTQTGKRRRNTGVKGIKQKLDLDMALDLLTAKMAALKEQQ